MLKNDSETNKEVSPYIKFGNTDEPHSIKSQSGQK